MQVSLTRIRSSYYLLLTTSERKRHLKCDEAKPSCKTCSSSGRDCEGYQDPWRIMTTDGRGAKKLSVVSKRDRRESQFSVITEQFDNRSKSPESSIALELPHEPVTASTVNSMMSLGTIDGNEKPYVDFFRLHTIPQLSRGLQVDFWESWVLQVLFSHPIVWYSALAVSAMHRKFVASASSTSKEHHHLQALHYYSKAIELLVPLRAADLSNFLIPVLTSCVLFICFEVSLMKSRHLSH